MKAAFAPPSSPASIRQRRILIAVLAVIVLLLAYRVVFTHRDNAFEKIAGNVREKQRALNAAETAEAYGRGFRVATLYDAIRQIDYPSLDLSHLRPSISPPVAG